MGGSRQNEASLRTAVLGFAMLCGLVALIAVAFFIMAGLVFTGLSAVISNLGTLDAAIDVALITGCVSIVTVMGGALLNSWLSYRHKSQEFLRKRREKPYRKLVEINFKMLQRSKMGEEYTAEEMLSDYMEFGQELALWGSAKAIRLWDEWRMASVDEKPDPRALLFSMENVLAQLRIDMGQRGKIRKGDILKIYINDLGEA